MRRLAEQARQLLLSTNWNSGEITDALGRELLHEGVRSGALFRPLASTDAVLIPEEDLPSAEVAICLAAYYAAGLLAVRGECIPGIIVPIVTDVLRQLKRVGGTPTGP